MASLKIRTHVGRDILQSAQSFKTPEAAIWEYVVNSLQYVHPGVVAQVSVTLDPRAKTVTILDNGEGMDRDGLGHFFTMHGENRERRRGVPGRGKFGTGKSAAFGIGTALRVETVRDEVRQRVYVDRAMIEAADGDAVGVRFEACDEPAPGVANGTVITISGIKVKMSREPVVSLIERHLTAFRANSPVVNVNGRPCQIRRVAAATTREFVPSAGPLADLLGDIHLTVSTSLTPLDETARGVAVTVGAGNLVAVVMAGVEAKEYGNRLFGEVDVPALDDPSYDPVGAYSNNRDLALNPAHPVAMALIAFIGASLETVRADLVDAGRKARADADALRLKATTSAIEELLNADLDIMRERLNSMSNVYRRTSLLASATGPDYDGSLTVDPTGVLTGSREGVLGGNEGPTEPTEPKERTGDPSADPTPGGDLASPAATADEQGTERVAPAGGKGAQRPRGGLTVKSDHLGADFDRSHWDKENRVITINLDHPVVVAARGVSDDEASFRRLCHEIAFTQYAIALADLQLERDAAMDASDAMFEVREALSRVWAGAASLYAV
jgi:hypothetical protein